MGAIPRLVSRGNGLAAVTRHEEGPAGAGPLNKMKRDYLVHDSVRLPGVVRLYHSNLAVVLSEYLLGSLVWVN